MFIISSWHLYAIVYFTNKPLKDKIIMFYTLAIIIMKVAFNFSFRDIKDSETTVVEMDSQGNIPERVEHHPAEPQAFARAR